MTNNRVVLSRVRRMRSIQQMIAGGEVDKMPKKEAARLRRELMKLERNLGGIADMRGLPAAMVVVDVMRESIAVQEAKKLGLSVVALVDSNCDPDPIDYVVPGNDDAVRAIKVVIDALASAIQEGLLAYGKESPAAAAEAAPAAAATPEPTPAPSAPVPASAEPAPDLPPAAPAAAEEPPPPEPVAAPVPDAPAEDAPAEDAVPAAEAAPAEESPEESPADKA